MSDFIDRVQERVQQENDDALARHSARRREGLPHCEECGETISPLRQGMGARLCMPHQVQAEQRGRR